MNKPKERVVYISFNRFNTFLCDGVSNSSLELLRFLRARGHEVAVFTFFSDEPYKRSAFQHLVGGQAGERRSYASVLEGIPVHQECLPFAEPILLRNPRLLLRAITAKLREEKVDLALTSEDDLLTLFAVSALDLPGWHYFHSLSYIKNLWQFPWFIKLLKKRSIFAASSFLKKKVEETLGLEAEVWYPLFDLGRYRVPHPEGAAASLGYYSGGRHKGDPVVNRMIRKKPEWEFTVVGRNYGPPAGPKPPNLHALGDAPDYRRFYGGIRLLLVPSLLPEGFCRVILEAAVNGIPAVANRVGGIPEALGQSGVLVDFNGDSISKASLARLAETYLREAGQLLSDAERYQELSRRARARAQEYQAAQDALSHSNYEKYFGQ